MGRPPVVVPMVYEFSCNAPDCEFSVRSSDDREVIDLVMDHAHEKHGRRVDADHVRERMTEV